MPPAPQHRQARVAGGGGGGEQQINAMKFIISVVSSSVSVGQFEVYISVDLSRVCLNLDFEQTLSLSLLKGGFKVKV